MDFTGSDHHRLIGDTLTRLLQDHCDFAARTAVAYDSPYHLPALWDAMGEMGLFLSFLPEDQDGIGGGGFDILTVFEPLGHALCPEPVLGQLMGLRLLAACGAETDTALTGSTRLAVAIGEPDAPWDLADITTTAKQTPDGWQLQGRKSVVYGGPGADQMLVAAMAQGTPALFALSPADTTRSDYAMIDGGGASEVILDAAPAQLLLPDATQALNDALDWGRLALAAEALGAMAFAFATLIEHLKTRQQFGKPLASFQALQHRTVDLKVEMEQARSITIRAAHAMGTAHQSKAVAQMKTLIGRTAILVAEETIQMQGGIAMTWDHPASHYAKRLTMIDAQLGDADYHLSRLIR